MEGEEEEEWQAAASVAGLVTGVMVEKQLRMKTGKRKRQTNKGLATAVLSRVKGWEGGSESG